MIHCNGRVQYFDPGRVMQLHFLTTCSKQIIRCLTTIGLKLLPSVVVSHVPGMNNITMPQLQQTHAEVVTIQDRKWRWEI